MADAVNTSASAAASSMGSFDPISAGIQAGTEIAKTIASIVDMNKRRKFEQAVTLLSNTQQRQLNEQLAAAKDENDKITILSNSLTNYLISQANANARKDIILYAVAGGLAVILLVTALILSNKKKAS